MTASSSEPTRSVRHYLRRIMARDRCVLVCRDRGGEMGLLEGQRAFITGGASGIGRATARMMAAEGARVAVADIDGEGAKAVADEIGGLSFEVDVTDLSSLDTAVRETSETFGGLSIAFNNAGGGLLANIHEYTAEQWD